MARDRLHHGTAAIHWAADAHVAVTLCGHFQPICGVDSIDFDRFITSNWESVTCKRCLRHKRRIARFKFARRKAGEQP